MKSNTALTDLTSRTLGSSVRLSVLVTGVVACVASLDAQASPVLQEQLTALGFVPGEQVRVVRRAVLGGDALVVEVGPARFAMRGFEASAILLQSDENATPL